MLPPCCARAVRQPAPHIRLCSRMQTGYQRAIKRICFTPAISSSPRASDIPMKIRKAVFPVAGLGTRVLPATKAMPKEMLTIVDKPLIQYVYDEAREAGIEHFIFVTGRNKGVIEDHFDQHVRTRHHAGRARQQEGRAGHSGARPARRRRHQFHPAAGAARSRSRGLVRARHRRRRTVCGGAAGRTGAEHAGLPGADDRGRKQARRKIQSARGRSGARSSHPSIRHLRRRQTHGQDVRGRRHGGEAAARAPRRPISRSPGATSCSRKSSRSSKPRSAAPAARSSSPTR